MTAGQRRTLWLCVVGLTYIFWYEASGVALFWKENAPRTPLVGVDARHYFWQQFSYGVFFLLMGALLTVLLRRKEQPARYTWQDWLGLAVGLGLLAGTAWRSYPALQ